jgi:hypothetical protein
VSECGVTACEAEFEVASWCVIVVLFCILDASLGCRQ